MHRGTRGRNALTDGDPRKGKGTGSIGLRELRVRLSHPAGAVKARFVPVARWASATRPDRR